MLLVLLVLKQGKPETVERAKARPLLRNTTHSSVPSQLVVRVTNFANALCCAFVAHEVAMSSMPGFCMFSGSKCRRTSEGARSLIAVDIAELISVSRKINMNINVLHWPLIKAPQGNSC